MTAQSAQQPAGARNSREPDPSNLTSQSNESGVFGTHKKILIVDDEPNIVDFLCVLLEDEGYRVYRAADGLQAIDVIERVEPALIISDVRMPGLNGEDLARRVVIGTFRTSPRIILMSAMDCPGNSRNVPFIGKPFDIDQLLDLVKEQMRQQMSH